MYFYELIFQDSDPYTISKLSAKYQFCAIHTADNTDGKVTGGGKKFHGRKKFTATPVPGTVGRPEKYNVKL